MCGKLDVRSFKVILIPHLLPLPERSAEPGIPVKVVHLGLEGGSDPQRERPDVKWLCS